MECGGGVAGDRQYFPGSQSLSLSAHQSRVRAHLFPLFKVITDALAKHCILFGFMVICWAPTTCVEGPEDRKLTNTHLSAESHGFLGKRLHPLLPNPSQPQALGSSSWRCVVCRCMACHTVSMGQWLQRALRKLWGLGYVWLQPCETSFLDCVLC